MMYGKRRERRFRTTNLNGRHDEEKPTTVSTSRYTLEAVLVDIICHPLDLWRIGTPSLDEM